MPQVEGAQTTGSRRPDEVGHLARLVQWKLRSRRHGEKLISWRYPDQITHQPVDPETPA